MSKLKPFARYQHKARQVLVEARESAGFSQIELSLRLGKFRTYMQKIESGTRRLELADFIVIAQALGNDPVHLLKRIMEE
jgi:transcriptional regulator with XRE-family HTH domain